MPWTSDLRPPLSTHDTTESGRATAGDGDEAPHSADPRRQTTTTTSTTNEMAPHSGAAAAARQARTGTRVRRAATLLALATGLGLGARWAQRLDEYQGAEGGTAVSLGIFVLPLLGPLFVAKDLLVPAWLEAAVAVAAIRRFMVPPAASFDPAPHTPPDYGAQERWAWSALPHVSDTADLLPPHCGAAECAPEDQSNARADLFYLSPSIFYSTTQWNGDWNSSSARYLMREAIIPQQAMLYNHVARVFAPMVRQMSGFAYFADGAKDALRRRAADVAYGDARAAFEHYLRSWGGSRPFILAGHSQGSEYVLRLLRDVVARDDALRSRFVAAYVPGMPLYQHHLARIGFPACVVPDATGCVAAWQSVEEGFGDLFPFETSDPELRRRPGEPPKRVCVNPLTWTNSTEYAGPELNSGAMHIVQWPQNLAFLTSFSASGSASALGPDSEEARLERQRDRVRFLLPLKPHVVGARCSEDGLLNVDPPPRGEVGNSPAYVFFPVWRFSSFPGRNLHPLDVNLFWANIRDNAAVRVAAFLARSGRA